MAKLGSVLCVNAYPPGRFLMTHNINSLTGHRFQHNSDYTLQPLSLMVPKETAGFDLLQSNSSKALVFYGINWVTRLQP